MISFTYFIVLGCFAYCLNSIQGLEEEAAAPAPKDDSQKLVKDIGYLRFGNPYLRSSLPNKGGNIFYWVKPQNPTETNEISNGEEAKRPLFLLTTFEDPQESTEQPSAFESLIGIRKKRDADTIAPETSEEGKTRVKRTHCKKCGGGGGYGGYYTPVTYAVYPVYSYPTYSYPTYSYPSYGGGCNTCGGGGGGGGGYSYSESSSSAKSSSKSWGYGRK